MGASYAFNTALGNRQKAEASRVTEQVLSQPELSNRKKGREGGRERRKRTPQSVLLTSACHMHARIGPRVHMHTHTHTNKSLHFSKN